MWELHTKHWPWNSSLSERKHVSECWIIDLTLKQTNIKCKISVAKRTWGQTQKSLHMEMNWGRAIQTNPETQPTTLPWKHWYPASFLLRCAYKRLLSPSQSLSSAEIGTEEAAYLLFILLLHLQLNSALSWTDEHATLLGRKISRLKLPWTRSVFRLYLYILISLPLSSFMRREVQSIHTHLHKIGTRAQGVKHPGLAEMPHWCWMPRQREGRDSEHCPLIK